MIRHPLFFFPALLLALFSLTALCACGDDGTPENGQENGEEENPVEDPEDSLDPCTFNEDCVDSERCVCDIDEGCFCRYGTRGTGVSGEDTCVDGNDCETALCVEGPEDVYYCSGPCAGADDCGSALPVCADIAFLGRVCIREPN